MPTYIGKVQINQDGEIMPVGSTLYGECASAANAPLKEVTLSNFSNYIHGVTIHVKFIYGNTAINNVQLQVGSTSAANVNNTFICNAGDIVSFTLEHRSSEPSGNFITTWQVNATRAHITSSNNIITTIDGQQVNAATQAYVDNKTASIDGITGPMHFKGVVQELPQDNTGYTGGDVVVLGQQEYVYDGTSWRLLGDEGSYVLKTSQSTGSAIGSAVLTPNTPTSFSPTDVTASAVTVTEGQDAVVIDSEDISVVNVRSVGELPTASVDNGLLTITLGTPMSLADPVIVHSVTNYTAQKIPNIAVSSVEATKITNYTPGSPASLATTNIDVITPAQQTP